MSTRTTDAEVVVIGAGVSGCSAAIALRQLGVEVTLVEKSEGRPHRFCGEFISGEALDSLEKLGLRQLLPALVPNRVRRLGLYGLRGESYQLQLGSEGIGLSRRSLDSAMLEHARSLGACILEGALVTGISGDPRSGHEISVELKSSGRKRVIRPRAVIGAHGKHSSLDRILGRRFVRRASGFVGVKRHFRGVSRGHDVELYLFPGGYCGVVGIEDGLTNVCLLATQKALRAVDGKPAGLLETAGRANPFLAAWIGRAEAVPESLMAVGGIPFSAKEQVVNGIFMAGDSAGVQAPFLGVGVAGGMRSALVCAEIVARWTQGRLDFQTAADQYESWWRERFAGVQRWGTLASRLLCRPIISGWALRALNRVPEIGADFYWKSRAGKRLAAWPD